MSDEQACENHPFKLEWLEHAERPQESPSLPSISSLTLRQVGKALSSAAINQFGSAGCQQVLQTSLQQAAIDRWLQHGTRCTVASFRFWPVVAVVKTAFGQKRSITSEQGKAAIKNTQPPISTKCPSDFEQTEAINCPPQQP